MNTQDIAKRLVTLCSKGDFEAAQKELYSADAVSIEPEASAFAKVTKGLPAIMEKGRKFAEMIETRHSIHVSDPIVAGELFACTMTLDVTMKGGGRMTMAEICVYETRDGKVVSEHFHS
jgi:ketosteroid isomerase-like protein